MRSHEDADGNIFTAQNCEAKTTPTQTKQKTSTIFLLNDASERAEKKFER